MGSRGFYGLISAPTLHFVMDTKLRLLNIFNKGQIIKGINKGFNNH